MKNHSIGLLVLAIALGILTAPPSASAQNPIIIEIYVGLGTGSQSYQLDGHQALQDEWNAQHDDVQIEFEYSNDETAYNWLTVAFSTGNAPAIVGPMSLSSFYDFRAWWLDLTPYLTRDAALLDLEDYDPQVLSLFEQANGQIPALAFGLYPSALWVNEDLFEDAGVPLPPTTIGASYINAAGASMVWDWTTLAQVAQAVTMDANGRHANEAGFDADQIEAWGYGEWWLDLRSLGLRFGATTAAVSADGTRATLDEPAYQTAAEWMHRGVFEQHFIPTLAQGDTLWTPFESGRLAMWYVHTWYTGLQCCTHAANFNWGVYAPPAVPGTNGAVVVAPLHFETFAISRDAYNPDAAWEVLKWLNSAEISQRLCQLYDCMPARRSARDLWRATMQARGPNMNLPLLESAVHYADTPSADGYLPRRTDAYNLMRDFEYSLRSDPALDVAAGLAQLNTDLQTLFDQANP